MKIAVDLDGTLCTWHPREYHLAKPNEQHIERVQKLYDKGHTIWIYTARGASLDTEQMARDAWEHITCEQLKIWQVPFHELIFQKPAFDILIDDRAVQFDSDWLDEIESGHLPHWIKGL